MSFVYSVYGLRFRSNQPILGLADEPNGGLLDCEVWLNGAPAKSTVPGDVVRERCVSNFRDRDGQPTWSLFELDNRNYLFKFGDGDEFVVARDGREIRASWSDNLSCEDVALDLLGGVLGFVLRLQGIPCLHASAVAVGDRALALVGPGGSGKSTMAAALARQGCAVISDDIVTLRDKDGLIEVHPGYSYLRLFQDSLWALHGDAALRLMPSWNKLALHLTENGYRFQRGPVPLASVYFLGEHTNASDAPRVEPLDAQQALHQLLANLYLNQVSEPSMRRRDFAVLARLANDIPIRSVTPHADLAQIPALCALILSDFQQHARHVLSFPE